MTDLKQAPQTLVQCDFDGTVTEEDVSFLLLDAFANPDWRQILQQYQEGKITVGRFNTEAFSMVAAGKQTLLEYIKRRVKVRPGFHEMVAYCRKKGVRFTVVSNGLDFYIERVLEDIGLKGLEFHAAQTRFHSKGLTVQYIGPDGNPLDSDFKLAYVDLFLNAGYRLIYIGNGDSDFVPAKHCHHVFATGTLLDRCQQADLDCVPFNDFNEIIRVVERLQ